MAVQEPTISVARVDMPKRLIRDGGGGVANLFEVIGSVISVIERQASVAAVASIDG